MTTRETTSREYAVESTEKWRELMRAMSEWLDEQPYGVTWDGAEEELGALMRAVRFGDSTCPRGCGVTNWPSNLEAVDVGTWAAWYTCTGCGSVYCRGHSDNYPTILWQKAERWV